MADRSDEISAFRESIAEQARIKRAIERSIASIDETACRSQQIISETRELIAAADKLRFW